MTARYRRSDHVLWRRSHGAVLVMSPGHHEVVSLQGPGTALWELLALPATAAEVIRSLASMYGIAPETVAGDVAPLLDDLVARHIVRVQEAA